MKPLNVKNYGSIPHLSSSKLGIGDHYVEKGMERILTEKKRDKNDVIFAYEKYDGSNVGICKVDNKIYALTRSGYEAKTSQYDQHHFFDEWVYNNEKLFLSLLKNGERIAGEWLFQAHGLKYRIEGEPILFFDYFNTNNKRVSQSELRMITENYNLKMPRLLHIGDSISVDELIPILNQKTDSIKSEDNPEGIIFRVERNDNVDFLAKWVRSDFETGKYLINVSEKTYNDVFPSL